MAGLTLLIVSLLVTVPAVAQQDQQFKKAGVCARCHVASVVEWGMSGHSRAGTNCVACHGTSQGHVADERNNVKPDRVPHGTAVTALCVGCHNDGCPKSKKQTGCETCHHVHALVDPRKPPSVRDDALEKRAAQWKSYKRDMEAGERAMQLGQWEKARTAFRAALQELPADRRASDRLRACERRLGGALPGFEVVGGRYDNRTGLPREVRVTGITPGFSMLLVPGGDFEMGSERFPNAKPVHTVTVEPFYLAKLEVTQAEWKALMGSNPSTEKGDSLPVESVSWEDAQSLLEKLNDTVVGGGFRLPTEAEWEFVARAGAAPDEPLAELAWFDSAAPHPVGTKKPDRLGFFDIRGNVWEWTSSLSKPYPYDASDGREDSQAKGLRILRGGSYADTSNLLAPDMRHSERPNRRLRWNGIRLARSVPGR